VKEVSKENSDPDVIMDVVGQDDFRDKLKLQLVSDASYVIMLSISERDEENIIRRLAAKRGVPLVPYAYNAVGEYYNIRCVEFMSLGLVPVSFQLTLPGVPLWKVRVPMPEEVLERFLSEEQKLEVAHFKATAKEANLRVEYLQMVSCY
jgi:hypothetical protein